jgi:hypothetical protein
LLGIRLARQWFLASDLRRQLKRRITSVSRGMLVLT